MIAALCVLLPVLVAVCSDPPSTAPSSAQGQLIIVHPALLAEAAREWREHRAAQGWTVTLLEWKGGDAETLRNLLHEWIHATQPAMVPWPIPQIDSAAVLLLGDVPSASLKDGLPTFRFEQPDKSLIDRHDAMFSSDGPYQDLDDDGLPDVMLGRVPVSTLEAARAFLAKIRAAESSPASESSRRVEVVGGEGHFGPYDALLEILTSALFLDAVPPEYLLRVSYAKATSPFCPPPSSMTEIVREQALGGALLFNYIGHGHAEGLDRLQWGDKRLRILDTRLLATAAAATTSDAAVPVRAETPAIAASSAGAPASSCAAPGGVALLVCCNTGWFDLADKDCFAEALLRQPSGPIAVIAGSRPTHPYANALIEREGVRRLLGDRPTTVGAWDLAVTRALASIDREPLDLIAAPIASQQQWPLSLRALRRQHALLYNLLGDPTTRIVHAPRTDAGSVTLSQTGLIKGSAPGAGAATATITIMQKRRPTRPDIAAAPPGAADLEERAGRNWPRANEWSLWQREVPVIDGRFSTQLPMPLPEHSSYAVVKVLSLAQDASSAAPIASDAGAATPIVNNPTSTGGADHSAVGPQALRLLLSIDLAPLVRFGADGKGLPADRGPESGGTRAPAR